MTIVMSKAWCTYCDCETPFYDGHCIHCWTDGTTECPPEELDQSRRGRKKKQSALPSNQRAFVVRAEPVKMP